MSPRRVWSKDTRKRADEREAVRGPGSPQPGRDKQAKRIPVTGSPTDLKRKSAGAEKEKNNSREESDTGVETGAERKKQLLKKKG